MENSEIINAINKLTEKKSIKVRQIPEFPLSSSVDKAKAMLTEAILATDKSIKELVWNEAYDKVVKWMVNPERKGINFTGDPGLLKTTITQLAIPVMFYIAYKIILKPINADEIHESWAIFNQSPVIIVDDIGTEPPLNDYGIKSEPFNKLVDFCEKRSKILIITHNLKSKQISSRYGIRTIDRLDLLCKDIKIEGESLRK